MRQGIWFPHVTTEFTKRKEAVVKLIKYYKELGFNSVWGSVNEDVHAAAREAGLEIFQNLAYGYCPNGYAFRFIDKALQSTIPDTDRFRYHPKWAKWSERYLKYNAVCPTVLGSEKFYPKVLAGAKKALMYTDHVYVNWEPYIYQKYGCVCAHCKAFFLKFAQDAGVGRIEALKMWPDCVIDREHDLHNRFTSHQIALVHKRLHNGVREASKELGRTVPANFVPAIATHEFNPGYRSFRYSGAREYVNYLDAFTVWGMTYGSSVGVVNLPKMIGNNLMMAEEFDKVYKIARRTGRTDKGRTLPRMYNVSGIHFVDLYRFAMPRAFYVQAVMNFFHGLDGHASYREWGMDARFMRLRAKAARIMATYEQVVMHGTPDDRFSTEFASPVPKMPYAKILHRKSYRDKNTRLISLGNDYYMPVFVRLKVTGVQDRGRFVLYDRMAKIAYGPRGGFSAGTLARGVLIDIPGKEFRILEVLPAARLGELGDDVMRLDEAATAAKLTKMTRELSEHAHLVSELLK